MSGLMVPNPVPVEDGALHRAYGRAVGPSLGRVFDVAEYASYPKQYVYGKVLWVRITLTSGEVLDGTMPLDIRDLNPRGLTIRTKGSKGGRPGCDVSILRHAIQSAVVLGTVGTQPRKRKSGVAIHSQTATKSEPFHPQPEASR